MPNVDQSPLEQERDRAQEALTGGAILRGRAFEHIDNPDLYGPPCDMSLDERRATLSEHTARARSNRAQRDFEDDPQTDDGAGRRYQGGIWPLIRAGMAAGLLALALPLAVFAHHTIAGECETVKVLSEQGTVVHLTGAHDLTFGPLGAGDWPTEYVLAPVPAGDYHATFTKDGKLDAENDVTVAACPSTEPTATPTPTASTVTATGTPHIDRTPPPTSAADTADTPTDRIALAVIAVALLFVGVMVRLAFKPRSRRPYR